MKLCWIFILVFFLSLGIDLIPQGTCQNTGIVDINAYPTISGIDFKNGIVTFSNLYLRIDANESFIVYIFTTALPTPTMGDSRTTYDNKTGIYSLSQQEFSNGFQLKFSLGEDWTHWTLINDRLECGIAIGLNITSSVGAKNVYPTLDFSLQNDWDTNATIKEATSQEASQYALYGTYAINQSIALSGLTQFYVVKIDVTRKPNLNNFLLYWSPLLLVFILLLVSLKLVIERDLANSLLVYVSTAIFAFGYLQTLRDITPPMMTSLEVLTLVDVSLSFILSITSILRRRPKEHKEQTGGSGMNEKEPKDEILELIQLIDRYKCYLFKWYDVFSGMIPILFAILVSYIVIEPVLIFGTMSNIDRISGALALTAIVIALFSLTAQFLRENIVSVNFKRILKLSCVEEDKKPLLKALIKIKANNREFDLKQIYGINASMFTREKLIEKLYD
jgi:hypothetical protein